MKGLTGLFSVSQSAKGSGLGDSVAEWSARQTRIPVVPGSSPALALADLFSVVASSNPRPRL